MICGAASLTCGSYVERGPELCVQTSEKLSSDQPKNHPPTESPPDSPHTPSSRYTQPATLLQGLGPTSSEQLPLSKSSMRSIEQGARNMRFRKRIGPTLTPNRDIVEHATPKVITIIPSPANLLRYTEEQPRNPHITPKPRASKVTGRGPGLLSDFEASGMRTDSRTRSWRRSRRSRRRQRKRRHQSRSSNCKNGTSTHKRGIPSRRFARGQRARQARIGFFAARTTPRRVNVRLGCMRGLLHTLPTHTPKVLNRENQSSTKASSKFPKATAAQERSYPRD